MTTANIVLNCLVLFLSSIEAARILAVLPTPSISHQVAFRPLILELAKRGHELTVITTDPQIPKGKVFTNLTEIDLHDISYGLWRQEIGKTTTGKKDDLTVQMAVILNTMTKLFKEQVKTSEVQNLINNRDHFDLLLAETCFRPSLAFAHIFNIPAILVSSFGSMFNAYEVVGAPTHPILYSSVFRQRLRNLTLWEKINELYTQYTLDRIYRNSENDETKVLRMLFGKDFPSYPEIATKYVQMSFFNAHPIWDNNRPVPPSVVYMGGIHQKPKNSLPEDLESYLNSSKSGVIYISFGTNVFPSMLPPEKIRMMTQVFSELPYDVLWKYDKDELPGKSANIKLSKWLPQSDVLRHPKIKVFITQGGLQSTDEAITAGVPLVGMPMLGDQWYNVEQYVHHKIGVRLDMETLTKDEFKNAIQTVIEDKSYKTNTVKLRSVMHDQPETGLERAVWWVEYVLRHGGASHLHPPTANITWTEYLELNLIAIVLSSFILFATLTFILLRYIFVFVIKNYVVAIKIKET